MKKYIYAMSMNRGDLRDYIESHTRQVIIALAQLYLFPIGNRVHWRKEVWEKFNTIHTLKPLKKLPSAKFIFDNSYSLYLKRIPALLQYAIDKEEQYSPIDTMDYEEFRVIVYDYFIWLSDYFSQTADLAKSDVLEELDRLGLTEVYE